MRHLPYNTGKVRIGDAYIPPLRHEPMSRDMERLQRSMIAKPPRLAPLDDLFVKVAYATLAIVASVLVFIVLTTK